MRYLALLVFVISCSFTSCDYASGEVMVLNNQSDSTIYASMNDSSLVFPPYTSTTIYDNSYPGTLDKSNIANTIDKALHDFKLYTDETHTKEMDLNYKDGSNWTHDIKRNGKKHYGDNIYTLTIENEDL